MPSYFLSAGSTELLAVATRGRMKQQKKQKNAPYQETILVYIYFEHETGGLKVVIEIRSKILVKIGILIGTREIICDLNW